MTNGEKMVWAAYYGANYREAIKDPPREAVLPKNKGAWEEWEEGQIASVIEGATYAVLRMRKMKKCIEEGFGQFSDTYQMLCGMLED